MIHVRTALVVDDSKLVTAVMRETLRPHCDQVIIANSLAEARPIVATLTAADLLLTDVFLGDGVGFELLQAIAKQRERPAIIVCSSRATPENERRAKDLGAIAFLGKPLSAQAVLIEWGKHHRGPAIVDRAARVRLFAQVYVTGDDPSGTHALAFEIHDLSHTGAFLVTQGPLAVGSRLALTIVAGAVKASVLATVARVQEPAWIHVGGVGVAFDPMSDETAAALEAMVQKHGVRTAR